MPKPEPISPQRLEQLRLFVKQRLPGHEFERLLCVWLRSALNLSTKEIAKVTRQHVNTVRYTQKDFIKRGLPAIAEDPKGGRYHALMSQSQEREFFSQFAAAIQSKTLPVAEVKAALEKHLGKAVNTSTVYRMIKRNVSRETIADGRARSHSL